MEETRGYHSHQYVIDENKSLPIPPQSTISSPHLLDYDKTEQQQEFNQQTRKNPSGIPSTTVPHVPNAISSTTVPLNPGAPQWFSNQSSWLQQAVAQPHYQTFERLMETQDHQNVALQRLVQQQQQSVMALTLPQPTIKVFTGDPIDYNDFVRGFEHLVEEKTLNPSARLYYLIQYTSGPVQDLMKSCLTMKNDEGYIEARKLLKDRYGQGYKIAAAHALTEGSPIKNEDGDALVKFSIQLTSCTNTLKEIGCLSKLDHPENLKKIIGRLPFGMRLKWRDAVDHIVENEGRDITIKDVTSFVTARARAATRVNVKLTRVNEKPKHQSGLRASGFAMRGDQPQQSRTVESRIEQTNRSKVSLVQC